MGWEPVSSCWTALRLVLSVRTEAVRFSSAVRAHKEEAQSCLTNPHPLLYSACALKGKPCRDGVAFWTKGLQVECSLSSTVLRPNWAAVQRLC